MKIECKICNRRFTSLEALGSHIAQKKDHPFVKDYYQIYPTLMTEIKELFENSYEKKENGCWEWTKSKFKTGYGLFNIPGLKNEYAHRWSHIIYKGHITDGLLIRHTCDNPSCVNPEHLIEGTDKDNAQDRVARGRSLKGITHPRYGIKLTQQEKDQKRKSSEKYRYFIKDPNGCEYQTTNMQQFSIEHNLNPHHMINVSNNKRKSYKGWICKKLETIKC